MSRFVAQKDAAELSVKDEFIAYSTIVALIGRAPLNKMPRLKPLVRKAEARLNALREAGEAEKKAAA